MSRATKHLQFIHESVQPYYDPTVLEDFRYYDGEPLESGGTSIQGNAAPAIQKLFKKGVFKPGMKVLDYGAGKYARNADYLRNSGLTVYAFDPFNGTGANGWELGNVSSTLPPRGKFDAAFTCFVINVVPKKIEDVIIKDIGPLAKTIYHITRNKDVFDSVKKALSRKDKVVGAFFVSNFASNEEAQAYEDGTLSDEVIMRFCKFGVQTSRGFQRIPFLDETAGHKLVQNTSGYKVFQQK